MSRPAPDSGKLFAAAIRETFAPALRQLGFSGSGRHFRRQRGDVIDAINVQASRHGDASCINLGLHFTCLPTGVPEQRPELQAWREIDCEFRTRLVPAGESDHWWRHGSTPEENRAAAQDIVRLYLAAGEPLFQQFPTSRAFADSCSTDALVRRQNRPTASFPWHSTDVRAALALARIHRHHGNVAQSQRFAALCLQLAEGGPLAEDLRTELKALAAAA